MSNVDSDNYVILQCNYAINVYDLRLHVRIRSSDAHSKKAKARTR